MPYIWIGIPYLGFLFFLFVSYRLIDRGFGGAFRTKLKWAVTVISLLPLTINLLGVDSYRWYALCTLNAFLALTIIKRRLSMSWPSLPQICAPSALRNAVILLIALNLASGSGLMDGYQIRTFPFTHLVRTWASAVRHRYLIRPTE